VVTSSSIDSTAQLVTKGGKQKNGVGLNVLPSHSGPKIRHKKRLHNQKKTNGVNIRQKVVLMLLYDDVTSRRFLTNTRKRKLNILSFLFLVVFQQNSLFHFWVC